MFGTSVRRAGFEKLKNARKALPLKNSENALLFSTT
jgi:hypothetical protein